jgi:hypothetical protein
MAGSNIANGAVIPEGDPTKSNLAEYVGKKSK